MSNDKTIGAIISILLLIVMFSSMHSFFEATGFASANSNQLVPVLDKNATEDLLWVLPEDNSLIKDLAITGLVDSLSLANIEIVPNTEANVAFISQATPVTGKYFNYSISVYAIADVSSTVRNITNSSFTFKFSKLWAVNQTIGLSSIGVLRDFGKLNKCSISGNDTNYLYCSASSDGLGRFALIGAIVNSTNSTVG